MQTHIRYTPFAPSAQGKQCKRNLIGLPAEASAQAGLDSEIINSFIPSISEGQFVYTEQSECAILNSEFRLSRRDNLNSQFAIWDLVFGIWNLVIGICHLPPPPPQKPHRIRDTGHYLFPLIVLIGLFLIILPACSKAKAENQSQSSASAPQYPIQNLKGQPSYKVSRIVDGDTVDIISGNDVVRIRLIGIDTPETVHPQKQVEFYGKEASNFLTNLLKGEEVYLEYENNAKPEYDKYGRLLAYFYRAPDGLFVNLEIVRQGYGHAYTKFSFKYMELFRAYEKRARENEKGLWAPDAGQPKDATTPPAQPPAVKEEPKSVDENTTEITVYITRTGKKYHRGNCEWLYASRIPITLKEAKSRGYAPCGACNPPE